MPPPGGTGAPGVAPMSWFFETVLRIYRRNVWVLIGIGAVWQLPLGVFGDALTARSLRSFLSQRALEAQRASAPNGEVVSHLLWLFPVAALVAWVVFSLEFAALVQATATAYGGGEPGILSAYRASWRRLGGLLPLGLLTAGLLLLAISSLLCSALLVGLLFRILFGNPGWLVEIAAIPAALVGVAIVWTRLQLATPALMVDGEHAIASLRHSWGLVKGRGWHVFGALLLVALVLWVAGGLVDGLAFAGGGVSGGYLRVAAYDLLGLIVDLALQPFFLIGVTVLYLDLRRVERQSAAVALEAQPGAA